MSSDSTPSLDQIAAEASEWFMTIRMGGLSPAERLRFADWLQASPLHVQEYLGVAETWGALSSAGAWPTTSAEALIEAARQASNVVALPSVPHSLPAPKGAAKMRRVRFAIAAVLAFLVLGAAVLVARFESHVYATARGQQRTVDLNDGSVVQLNTLSRMVVDYSPAQRRITLTYGEAFFRVAHDTARPFYVETPFGTVRAVGTEFNVYSRGDSLRVAVVEGRVQVTSSHALSGQVAPAGPSAISVGASESVERTAKGPWVRDTRPTSDATAWLQHRLVFENERLADVIAEFNRYTAHQMQVTDPKLSSLRISGSFESDEPETLVAYLEQVQKVQTVQRGSVTVFLRGKPAASVP